MNTFWSMTVIFEFSPTTCGECWLRWRIRKSGLVTCLYRGVASPTLGSRLEALGISTDFCAGVLAARAARRRHSFWIGFHAGFSASDLESIGGFEALVDYLADDYEIGRRIAERGLKVTLSDVVVETFLPPYTLRQFVDHQLRWGRTVRDSRRWGYLGLVLTFGFPWALLALVLSSRCGLGVGPAGRGPGSASRRGAGRGMVGFARSPGVEAVPCFRCGIWSPLLVWFASLLGTRWSGEATRSL